MEDKIKKLKKENVKLKEMIKIIPKLVNSIEIFMKRSGYKQQDIDAYLYNSKQTIKDISEMEKQKKMKHGK